MGVPADLQNAFLAHKPIGGAHFEHDDPVLVVGGEYAGQRGNLVSIEELGPDPVYLVELSSGKDVNVAQSLLQRAEA